MSRVLKMGLMVVAVLAMVVTSVNGAGFFDGFEAYDVGSSLQDQGGWKGWDNNPAGAADVSDAVAYAGTKSVEIAGAADLVHEFDVTGGQWTVSTMQYIPGNAPGTTYYILMDEYNDLVGPYAWAKQLQFNLADNTVRTVNDAIENVSLVRDAWVEIRVEADLDSNLADVYYNDTLLSSAAWGANPSIAAIDLFANGATAVYYDNVAVRVPEPATLTLLVMAALGLLVVARRR